MLPVVGSVQDDADDVAEAGAEAQRPEAIFMEGEHTDDRARKGQAVIEAAERTLMSQHDPRALPHKDDDALEQVERFLMSGEDKSAQAQPDHGGSMPAVPATEPPTADLHNPAQPETPPDWPEDVPKPNGEPRARRARGMKGPESPSEEELAEHLLTHLPY